MKSSGICSTTALDFDTKGDRAVAQRSQIIALKLQGALTDLAGQLATGRSRVTVKASEEQGFINMDLKLSYHFFFFLGSPAIPQ